VRSTPVMGLRSFAIITVALHVAAATNVFKSYTINVPFGVTVQGQGPVFVDFEFVPGVNQGPPHNTSLTVDPGVLFKLGHGFTFGMRAAFDVNTSRVGFIPLLNKSFPLHSQPSKSFFKTFFVELDVPVKFDRPPGERATNPVTLATQVGFGF